MPTASTGAPRSPADLVHDRTVFVLLCFIAGLAAIWCGWIGRTGLAWLGGIVVTATLTIFFSVQAANDIENDGLWPVGAAMVAISAPILFAAVAGAAHWLRRYQQGPDTE